MEPRPSKPNVLGYERFPEHVPVASFPEPGEAFMAAGRLEAEGVSCRVLEHAILEGVTARGATVAVEAGQLLRAVEVLEKTPARRCLLVRRVEPVDPTASTPPPTGRRAK